MTHSEVKGYIDQTMEFSTLQWVSFTGGEPFLLSNRLIDHISYASKLGLMTECVTNCFWAHSEQVARHQLSKLVTAGLDVINISADDFHQEFIPFERICNGFNAAMHLGLKVVLMCVTSKSSKQALDIVRAVGGEKIRIIHPNMETQELTASSAIMVESGFLPAGRAANLPTTEWVLDTHSSFEGGCPFVLRDISILPGGQVLACCSAGALTDVLNLGTVKAQRLSILIEVASQRPIIKILTREGPRGLLRKLNPESHFEPGTYISKCHLCYEMLSDPKMTDLCLVDD